jgi:hypothetical protein
MFGWAILGILLATQSQAYLEVSRTLAAICFTAVILCIIMYRKEIKR